MSEDEWFSFEDSRIVVVAEDEDGKEKEDDAVEKKKDDDDAGDDDAVEKKEGDDDDGAIPVADYDEEVGLIAVGVGNAPSFRPPQSEGDAALIS